MNNADHSSLDAAVLLSCMTVSILWSPFSGYSLGSRAARKGKEWPFFTYLNCDWQDKTKYISTPDLDLSIFALCEMYLFIWKTHAQVHLPFTYSATQFNVNYYGTGWKRKKKHNEAQAQVVVKASFFTINWPLSKWQQFHIVIQGVAGIKVPRAARPFAVFVALFVCLYRCGCGCGYVCVYEFVLYEFMCMCYKCPSSSSSWMTVKEQFLPSTEVVVVAVVVVAFDVFKPDLIAWHVAGFAPVPIKSPVMEVTRWQLCELFPPPPPPPLTPFTLELPPPTLEIPGDIDDEQSEEDEMGEEDEQGAKSKPPDTWSEWCKLPRVPGWPLWWYNACPGCPGCCWCPDETADSWWDSDCNDCCVPWWWLWWYIAPWLVVACDGSTGGQHCPPSDTSEESVYIGRYIKPLVTSETPIIVPLTFVVTPLDPTIATVCPWSLVKYVVVAVEGCIEWPEWLEYELGGGGSEDCEWWGRCPVIVDEEVDDVTSEEWGSVCWVTYSENVTDGWFDWLLACCCPVICPTDWTVYSLLFPPPPPPPPVPWRIASLINPPSESYSSPVSSVGAPEYKWYEWLWCRPWCPWWLTKVLVGVCASNCWLWPAKCLDEVVSDECECPGDRDDVIEPFRFLSIVLVV